MSDQSVIVYISQEGGEISDLQDLVDGTEVELDWVGSLNGTEVPIKVRLSDVDTDAYPNAPEELTTEEQRERYWALVDNGVDHDAALDDAKGW